MKAKLAFTAGLAVGYVVGTRVGRRGYENLKNNARAVWEMDAVQETIEHVQTTVKDPDVDTDPALNDDLGQDWTDEGGALPSGPAA